MSDRETTQHQLRALKVSTKALVRSNGGLDTASMSTRLSASTLGHYQNADHEGYIPIDVVADLELTVGNPVVTKTLADMQGYLLVKKPKAPSSECWLKMLGDVSKECGEVISGIAKVIAGDAKITAKELKKLRKDVMEAMEILATIDSILQFIEEDEG